MPQSNLPPLQSQDATFNEDGFEAVKTDLGNMALQIGQRTVLHLSGAQRVAIPRAGVAKIFAQSDTATASSSSTANHVLTAMRSGQVTDISLDSDDNEIVAYKEYFMGEIPVSQGSLISLEVTVTGSPSPTLSNDNFTVRCELSEE